MMQHDILIKLKTSTQLLVQTLVQLRGCKDLLPTFPLAPLTFCGHDVYDQVVPCRLKRASVIGSNLQHRGESLISDQCSLHGSSPADKAELHTQHVLSPAVAAYTVEACEPCSTR